jgi:hypothetical protein
VAKLRRYMLSWKPLDSGQIVGYKLYWSREKSPGYDADHIQLGNVREICLPDVFKETPPLGDPIRLGIAAVDKDGNESDIALLAEPYRAVAPPAPADISLKPLDEDKCTAAIDDAPEVSKLSFEDDAQLEEVEELARMVEPLINSGSSKGKAKYYDDLGFRKPVIDE